MRSIVTSSLVVCLLAFSACGSSDPNAFETHIGKLEESGSRDVGISDLQRLVKGIASSPDNEARRKEFGTKVIPVFEKIWDEAEVHRLQMLEMARDMGVPEAAPIWKRAIQIDGRAESREAAVLALQGIREANATQMVPALIESFKSLLDSPTNDNKGENRGQIRLEHARTLGELGDVSAVPVLISALEQPVQKQPNAVHKEVVKSLGLLRDARAVVPILEVQFRVPDSAGTQSLGERAKRALAGIGEPAVDPTLAMLRGELDSVISLASQNGVELAIVKQTAAGILGAIGSPRAAEDLVAFMPREDCKAAAPGASKSKSKRKKRRRRGKRKHAKAGNEPDPAAVSLRAFVARALGFIGNESAVPALCACREATRNPADLWEITSALGRIGGDAAFECLSDIVQNGTYDPEVLPNSDFRHEIRWEGARWLTLAAQGDNVAKAKAIVATGAGDPRVSKEMARWQPALEVAEKCGDDLACHLGVLADTSKAPVAREKAAFEAARLGKGDPKVGEAIASAFKVRNVEARVSMAHLAASSMAGKHCQPCADALQDVMHSERDSKDRTMQLPWLIARQSISKLRASAASAPTPAPEPAQPATKAAAAAGK